MVKVEEKFVRLTHASVSAKIKEDHINLKNIPDFKLTFTTSRDYAVAIYNHKIVSHDEQVSIEATFEGYYNVIGMKSEDDVTDLYNKCYDKLFVHMKKWLEETTDYMGIPDVRIP